MNDEILRINGFEIVEDGFDQDKINIMKEFLHKETDIFM